MKNKHNRFVAGMLAAGMFLSSATFVSAETATSSPSVEALIQQVQALLAQVQVLQTQLDATKKEVVAIRQELALTRALAFGSKGKDVSDLQEFLKNFPDIYPEGLVTGFYGHATEAAIKRLQEKHGLEKVGVVGPKTREKLHKLFSEHAGKGKGSSVVKHDDDDEDDDDDKNKFASTTGGTLKITVCHKEEKKHGGETISIGAPALSAHLAHGDTLGACSAKGTTTPDVTAPVISSLAATSITTSAATIKWNTNENADTTVWYGTVNPIDISSTTSATKVTNPNLGTTHEISLSGLLPNTTYYYIVASKDASGNQATGSQASFVTLTLDTSAPVLSNILATTTTATATKIMWNTDENSDSTVWYSTVTPVDVASTTLTTTVTAATLVTLHEMTLSGLTASTTYYYLVGSKDTAGNRATSSQASFITSL